MQPLWGWGAAVACTASPSPSAGSVLSRQVPDIVSVIHSKLQEVDEEHVRKSVQQTVYILASQHRTAVVCSLLGSSLPFDRYPPLRCTPGAPCTSAWLCCKPLLIVWLLTPVIGPCWNSPRALEDQHAPSPAGLPAQKPANCSPGLEVSRLS